MPAPLVLPAPSPPAPSTTQGSTFTSHLRHTPARLKKQGPLQAYLAPAPGVTLSPLLTHLGIPLPQLSGVVRRGEGLGVKKGGLASLCVYACWSAPNHNP